MADYYVSSKSKQQTGRELFFKGDARTIAVDFSTWADDNSNVSSVTWTTESGQAAISSESLSSNVATALVTTSQSGSSMIKLLATDGTHSIAFYVRIYSKDPQSISDDYGMVQI